MKEYNEIRTEIKAEFKTEIKNHRLSKEPALQKTMSVPEMRKLLGNGKGYRNVNILSSRILKAKEQRNEVYIS